MAETSLLYKPDFERAQQAWDALWNHELFEHRPCTRIVTRRAEKNNAVALPNIVPADSDFSRLVAQAIEHMEGHAYLGEAIPFFRPAFGPDQMAAFCGTRLVMSDLKDTSWSVKNVTDWSAALPLRIRHDNHWWLRMKEYHAVAEQALAGKCLLADIDMHSNIDLLEGLRGAEPLLFDMIDQPDPVLGAMEDARAAYREVYETFHRYGDKARLGTTNNLPFYARGRFNRIQADFIALLSPPMFRKFVLPAIEDEANYLDHSCFHLDGPDALVHLDDLLSIRKLDAIQWVSGAGQPPQVEWPQVLHKIQKAGKITILHIGADTVRSIHGQYDPSLLVYDVWVNSPDEGHRLLDWLAKNT